MKIETCKSFVLLMFKKKTAEQIEEEVRSKAYEIWKEKNGQNRTSQDDWEEAAKILKEEAEQKKWYARIFNWTGLKEKKGWDIVQLLVVPLSLGLIGFGFQYFSKQIEQQAATNKNEQEILAKYLDQMSDLLEKGLLTSTLDSEKFKIARAKTIITLHSVNPTRQHLVMQFLEASGLNDLYSNSSMVQATIIKNRLSVDKKDVSEMEKIYNDNGGILFNSSMSKSKFIKADFSKSNFIESDFSESDLLEADFIGSKLTKAIFDKADLQKSKFIFANLRKANLSNTNLTEADLSSSILKGAELKEAILYKAIIIGADLEDAILIGADFAEANLSDIKPSKANFNDAKFKQAILLRVNLEDVQNLKKQQLEGENAPLLCRVTLPISIKIDPDRDCGQLPKILSDRYPQKYPDIEKAEEYIKKGVIAKE